MKNPDLYSIGLNKDCYSMKIFLKWIFYALWHAFVVYFVVYYCLNVIGMNQPDGKAIGLYFGG